MNAAPTPLHPGRTIGILGTGQLGRMLAIAAAEQGFRVHVFGPEIDPPAAQVANIHTQSQYDTINALERFATMCDVVTFEFENVPTDALQYLQARAPLRPSLESLRVSQDRLVEKQYIQSLGLGVAPFAAIDDAAALERAQDELGGPFILKSRRLGYDGKGQVRLGAEPADAQEVWRRFGGVPAIAERVIPFSYETSVVLTRGMDGRSVFYDLPVNRHSDGILVHSSIGAAFAAQIPEHLAHEAQSAAKKIADALEHVGTLAVEFFVTKTDELIVNEIAPRVHNTGHWTLDGCLHDQFANHIRAISGYAPFSTVRHSDVHMVNLIGEEAEPSVLSDLPDNAVVHLYGKAEPRPGRKMGHVNYVQTPG